MEQVLLKLAEAAASGTWPAAIAIGFISIGSIGVVSSIFWFLSKIINGK